MVTIAIALAIFLLLGLDIILLPQQSRLLIGLLAGFCILACIVLFWPTPFEQLAHNLGVSNPISVLAFALSVLTVREMLISRSRHFTSERRLAAMIREMALLNSESSLADKRPKAS
jgi:hypothetical protein